jgi:hypothetical protein
MSGPRRSGAANRRQSGGALSANFGWPPEPGHFHLFGVDIDHVTFIR